MTYVNPELKRGEKFIQDLRHTNQKNQINELYWEFQNKEIRQYEVQKFNEKMNLKQGHKASVNVTTPQNQMSQRDAQQDTWDLNQSSISFGNGMPQLY
jgi:hypothetical protein